jgi:5,10-methylenetetrahydromethanopterin reductase
VRTAALPTTAEALRQARPTSVHWGILRWGGYWLEPAGLTLPPLTVPDAVWKIYPDLSHAHDWEAAIAATSFVPDEVVAQLCEAMGLIGTAEDCAARIAELTKLGVRNLYLMPLLTFARRGGGRAAFAHFSFGALRRRTEETARRGAGRMRGRCGAVGISRGGCGGGPRACQGPCWTCAGVGTRPINQNVGDCR